MKGFCPALTALTMYRAATGIGSVTLKELIKDYIQRTQQQHPVPNIRIKIYSPFNSLIENYSTLCQSTPTNSLSPSNRKKQRWFSDVFGLTVFKCQVFEQNQISFSSIVMGDLLSMSINSSK